MITHAHAWTPVETTAGAIIGRSCWCGTVETAAAMEATARLEAEREAKRAATAKLAAERDAAHAERWERARLAAELVEWRCLCGTTIRIPRRQAAGRKACRRGCRRGRA